MCGSNGPGSGCVLKVVSVFRQSADAVQLALKLDGSTLEGRSIRVKRSLKKSQNQAVQGRAARGPAPERARHQRRLGAPRSSAPFSGIRVDPNSKTKKKQKKKTKAKRKKSVHL